MEKEVLKQNSDDKNNEDALIKEGYQPKDELDTTLPPKQQQENGN